MHAHLCNPCRPAKAESDAQEAEAAFASDDERQAPADQPQPTVLLSPPVDRASFDGTSVVVLNMHSADAGLVTQWHRRSIAVAEPSDAAQALLTRIAPPGASAGASQTVTPAASVPQSPADGGESVISHMATPSSGGSGATPAALQLGVGEQQSSLHELFQSEGGVRASRDGTGFVWRCTFSSSCKMPDSSAASGWRDVHTVCLYEYSPAAHFSADEISSEPVLFRGKLVVCTSVPSEAVKFALIRAGAVGVLSSKEGADGGSYRDDETGSAESLLHLLQRLRDGATALEAREAGAAAAYTLCDVDS